MALEQRLVNVSPARPSPQVLAFPPQPAEQAVAPAVKLSRGDRALLWSLRDWLNESRLSADGDPERACALIAAEPHASAQRYAVALFRVLPRSTRRRLVFHAHGNARPSTDEMWLLRLLRAIEQDDEASVRALLGFRIRREARRAVRFLATGLATSLKALYSS